MKLSLNKTVTLQNNAASLTIDPFGGAITAFRLKDHPVNPLSFSFSNEQMPPNNQGGASYQGHFACIGRWGEPTPGEIKAGLPNHGEPANIRWSVTANSFPKLEMETEALKEGLSVKRTVVLDARSAVYSVTEHITNINPLGRLFNIVQHPTLAAPFLDETTVINCNASHGFDQAFYKEVESKTIEWSNMSSGNNAVFSFVVKPGEQYGWITAYSPTHNLLIGYLWDRKDYPWMHLWQHYNELGIQYCGVEFGTAGIHQPFNEILNTATTLFGEKTCAFIDAGETITKRFLSFIHSTDVGFGGVEDITISNGTLVIKPTAGSDVQIQLTQTILNEFSE